MKRRIFAVFDICILVFILHSSAVILIILPMKLAVSTYSLWRWRKENGKTLEQSLEWINRARAWTRSNSPGCRWAMDARAVRRAAS